MLTLVVVPVVHTMLDRSTSRARDARKPEAAELPMDAATAK